MNCATAAFDFDLESLTRLQEDADIMTYILFSAALGDVFEEPEVTREYIVRLPEILRKLRLADEKQLAIFNGLTPDSLENFVEELSDLDALVAGAPCIIDSLREIKNRHGRRQKTVAGDLPGEPGSLVRFGRYPQDRWPDVSQHVRENALGPGRAMEAPIEWLVLEKTDTAMLLLSFYGIDSLPYHHECRDISWEECDLRKWLNDRFQSTAFTPEEQRRIIIGDPAGEASGNRQDSGAEIIRDRIFCLSREEAERYFRDDASRICEPSEYAIRKGAFFDEKPISCYWWLRSQGKTRSRAVSVTAAGSLHYDGDSVEMGGNAVRPALWISL